MNRFQSFFGAAIGLLFVGELVLTTDAAAAEPTLTSSAAAKKAAEEAAKKKIAEEAAKKKAAEEAARKAAISSQPGYTFSPTPYGTVEIFKNGQRITTGTPAFAATNYGYKPAPVASAPIKTTPAPTTPSVVRTIPAKPLSVTVQPVPPAVQPKIVAPVVQAPIAASSASMGTLSASDLALRLNLAMANSGKASSPSSSTQGAYYGFAPSSTSSGMVDVYRSGQIVSTVTVQDAASKYGNDAAKIISTLSAGVAVTPATTAMTPVRTPTATATPVMPPTVQPKIVIPAPTRQVTLPNGAIVTINDKGDIVAGDPTKGNPAVAAASGLQVPIKPAVPATPATTPATLATPANVYTFSPTAYGTVQILQNGRPIATETPAVAVQQYGYKPPSAAAGPQRTLASTPTLAATAIALGLTGKAANITPLLQKDTNNYAKDPAMATATDTYGKKSDYKVRDLACLATVYTMIERQYGDKSASITEFYDDPRKANGNGKGAVLKSDASFQVTGRANEIAFNAQEFKERIKAGSPVILQGKTAGGLDHYVLAVDAIEGPKGTTFIINDPLEGQKQIAENQMQYSHMRFVEPKKQTQPVPRQAANVTPPVQPVITPNIAAAPSAKTPMSSVPSVTPPAVQPKIAVPAQPVLPGANAGVPGASDASQAPKPLIFPATPIIPGVNATRPAQSQGATVAPSVQNVLIGGVLSTSVTIPSTTPATLATPANVSTIPVRTTATSGVPPVKTEAASGTPGTPVTTNILSSFPALTLKQQASLGGTQPSGPLQTNMAGTTLEKLPSVKERRQEAIKEITQSGTPIKTVDGGYTLTNGSTVVVDKDKSAATYVPGDTTKKMAVLSDIVYSTTPSDIGQTIPLPDKSSATVLKSYSDLATGFQATAYRLPDGRIAVVYAGTKDFKESLVGKDGETDRGIATQNAQGPDEKLNTLNQQVRQARGFYADAAKDYGVISVVAGHSLGGALAQIVGAEKGVSTETFNAPGMTPFIEEFRTKNQDYKIQGTDKITNHIRSTDPIGNHGDHIGHVVKYEKDVNTIAPFADHDRKILARDLELGMSGRVAVDFEDVAQGLLNDLWVK